MKEKLIDEIQRKMLPHLNNEQLLQLQEVLNEALRNATITYDPLHDEIQKTDATDAFISAKRIEGCSEKTLHYYRKTIEARLPASAKRLSRSQQTICDGT